MSNIWEALESVSALAAVSATWRSHIGQDFDKLRNTFFHRRSQPSRSYPCPHGCGCWHKVIQHKDGSIVAICQCDPESCDDILLQPDDLWVYELNWDKLGRAITEAFGFQFRRDSLNFPEALEIGAYTLASIPIVLVICHEQDCFKQIVMKLVSKLSQKFLLLTPTGQFIDISSCAVMEKNQAKILPLNSCLALKTDGEFKTTTPTDELLAGFVVEINESFSEDDAKKLFGMVKKLDAENLLKPPTVLTVFQKYIIDGISMSKIMKQCHCGKGTVKKRVDILKKSLGNLELLRKYSDKFEKTSSQTARPKKRGAYRQKNDQN